MKKDALFNKKGKEILKLELDAEPFNRMTASFYKYFELSDPYAFRDELFRKWDKLEIFGRIYVAAEGINAQMSVPAHYWDDFLNILDITPELKGIHIKRALQDGNSFYKLTIKVREELVAYGVPEDSYTMEKVGNHLSAEEYNDALQNPDTVIVDMRNYYESEIGRFENSIIPDVETSKELLPEVKRILEGKENEQVLLYCTGGIRCEKASSYLIHHGFIDVNQLQGGIIQYAHDIKKKGLPSKFIGKNFVFDDRLGERVTDDVIAHCHICGDTCDTHTDCKNELAGCCSKACKDFASLPIEEQRIRRKDPTQVVSRTFFDSRIKPKLSQNI